MIDVSVIMAAWNAEATLSRAIQSALAQSGVSVEVIVADDASTDGTAHIAAGFASQNVQLLTLGRNAGPAAARNAAMAVARGHWIAVLDADDAYLPGRLASLLTAARTHALDLVADNMVVETGGAGRRLFMAEKLDGALVDVPLATYVANNRLFSRRPCEGYLKPMFSTGFMRRCRLQYDDRMRVGEDFMLVAEALTLGARFGRTREAGYLYSVGPGSISHRLTHADVAAMIDADRRYLGRYGSLLGPAESRAWEQHQRSLEIGSSFVAMIENIRSRDLPALARTAWQHPGALRHFAMPVRARVARLMRRMSTAQHLVAS